MKITRMTSRQNIWQMCVNHQFYTRGDISAYDAMLNGVPDYDELTDDKLVDIATDIYYHSERGTDLYSKEEVLENIIYIIVNEACYYAVEMEG